MPEEDISSRSESSESSGRLQMTSGSDSGPGLATTESDSSIFNISGSVNENDSGSENDSGMSVNQVGDVTNLCRQRRNQDVTTGVVTETGPYIPVSLGFSMVEDSDSWEEMVDENGVSIGVEVKSFRLNILKVITIII